MNMIMGQYVSSTPNILQHHTWLLNNDNEYRKAVEASKINRHKVFDSNMNRYLDEVIKETHGGKDLHVMGIMSAGLNPLTSKPKDFLPTQDKDAVVLIFTENSILLTGTRAAHGFYWNNIIYVLEMEPNINIIQVGEAFQLLIGDEYFTIIFRKILRKLNENNLGALEFSATS